MVYLCFLCCGLTALLLAARCNCWCQISPGVSRLRGVILYELQATLAAYARRKFSAGEISTDHMRTVMKVQSFLRN